jgi:repressor LexA
MTPAQQRVYEAIHELEQELGYAPSTREIGERAGYASTSTVHHHLERLLREGWIRRATAKQGYTTRDI